MHNPSSCKSRCPSAFLSVSLVPIVCTPPSVAKPLRFAILFGACPCSIWEPRGAMSAWGCGFCARVRWPVALNRFAGCVARCVPCHAVLRGSGLGCVSVSGRLPEVRVVWLGGTPAFSVAWRFSEPPCRRRRHKRSVIREQYPTAGSAQRGNPCSTEDSHSSPSGGRYVGEGPSAHPHQHPDSGAQRPGARPKTVSCRQLHLLGF